ncbi:FAD-binding protein [Devosia sp. CAU 1758]
MSQKLRNWAGSIEFAAASVARPGKLAELQEAVRRADKVRVLGSGHSFNRIADTDDTLVTLSQLDRTISIDPVAQTVTIDGGATYADIAPALHQAGYGLRNVASLPNITIAGAVATATHGSGDANQNLAAAVVGVTLVTASGELVSLRRGDPGFEGAVVNLGALGVMSEITLELVPSFAIRQNVYLGLPVTTLLTSFDTLMRRAYSVSLFTRWQGDVLDQIWVKALDEAGEPPEAVLGAGAANGPCHPIPGMDGSVCTGQMGLSGPWHERLFHFAIGNTASAGAELQSEFFVAREQAPATIAALHAAQTRFAHALMISEIRSVAADALWLSPAYGQETIGFHFTWKPDWDTTIAAVKAVEAVLSPFNPRPHWAKLFTMPAPQVQSRFPRLGDFRELAGQLDADGKFRNAYVTDLLFG